MKIDWETIDRGRCGMMQRGFVDGKKAYWITYKIRGSRGRVSASYVITPGDPGRTRHLGDPCDDYWFRNITEAKKACQEHLEKQENNR